MIFAVSFLVVLGSVFFINRYFAEPLSSGVLPAENAPPLPPSAPSATVPLGVPSSSLPVVPSPTGTIPRVPPTAASSSPPVVLPPAPKLPPLLDIELNSIVAIRCSFSNASGTKEEVRGSGIISSSEGYVITNRHIVDREWAARVLGEPDPGYHEVPDECVGELLDFSRTISPIPQATYPFSPYPYFDVEFYPSNWDMRFEVVFRPSGSGASAAEENALDFAVLKVKEWNLQKYTQGRTIPTLHAAPFLASVLPGVGEWTLIPGYAFQAIGENSFDTFRLLITTYVFSGAAYGDQKYTEIPMSLIATTESPDISGGRSGSPMFWRGYVVGLRQSTFVSDRRKGIQVSARIITEVLREENFLQAIERLF